MTIRSQVLGGLGLLLLALLMPAGASAQDKWKGTIVKEGEVTVVRNPKEPLNKTPVLELKEELSIGGSNAQDDHAFGLIQDVVVDDAGSIYVLDQRNSQVKVFDASGKYVRTIGRQGQGPGEFERPMNLSLNRAAGELAVHQPSRMSFYKPDGAFLRDVSFRGMGAVLGRIDSRGHIYRTEFVPDDNGPRYVAKKFGPDGAALSELESSPAPVSPKGAGKIKVATLLPASYFQLDQADNVVYGYPQAYDVVLFRSSDAKPFRKITRDYDLVEVSRRKRRSWKKRSRPGPGSSSISRKPIPPTIASS